MISLACCLLISCETAVTLPEKLPDGVPVDVVIEISAPGSAGAWTKSQVSMDRRDLDTLDVFIYQSGVLRRSLSFTCGADWAQSYSSTLRLISGDTYDVVVFANNIDHTAPATLTEALSGVYRISDYSTLVQHGLPMCGRETVTVNSHSTHINIPLTRLVSKLIISKNNGTLTHGTLELTSAKVCQMNSVCPFFSDAYAQSPSEVIDGDYATDNDLVILNAGWDLVFFVLENRQGDLLPYNTDPDQKLPEKISMAGGNPGLCTYIELSGIYRDRAGHMSGEPVTTRFYLGEDACRNFDVKRNWQYRVRLHFTDDMCLRSGWKLDFPIVDGRILEFEEPYYYLSPGESHYLQIITNLYYSLNDFDFEYSGDTEYFNVEFRSQYNAFSVQARDYAPIGAEMAVTVTSWDGRLSASVTYYVI